METWRRAWEASQAVFYANHSPRGHFRTSTQYPDLMAEALVNRIRPGIDAALECCGRAELVDIGAGDSTLIGAVRTALLAGGVAPHALHCTVVDVRPIEAPGIDCVVGRAPDCLESQFPHGIAGAVIAHEWLDDIPCDIVEVDDDGERRVVMIDATTGAERLGAPVDVDSSAWLDAWWPIREPGRRAEVGRPRDEAWQQVLGLMRTGVAVAIDYGHTRADRPAHGTLTGFAQGRAVAPVPDGRCNITAHVSMDSLAHQGLIATQRESIPASDSDLVTRSRIATLRDPSGLGAFLWRTDIIGMPRCDA